MTRITASQRRTIKEMAVALDCRYRITQDGEVHFYGRMPNSIETGWWLFTQSVDDAVQRAARTKGDNHDHHF